MGDSARDSCRQNSQPNGTLSASNPHAAAHAAAPSTRNRDSDSMKEAMAAASSNAPGTSGRPFAPSALSRISHAAPRSAATAGGAGSRNAPRQVKCSAMKPPTVGPMIQPSGSTLVKRPMARARLCGNSRLTTAAAMGTIAPPPSAAAIRIRIWTAMLGASAAATDATQKSDSEAMNIRRRP